MGARGSYGGYKNLLRCSKNDETKNRGVETPPERGPCIGVQTLRGGCPGGVEPGRQTIKSPEHAT